jgi:hypothetical protein
VWYTMPSSNANALIPTASGGGMSLALGIVSSAASLLAGVSE